MPRFLALDWTAQQMLVVSANVRRGTVTLERAAAWPESHGPSPESARALGPTLRERLKAAGIAPAPVLACVGRDRVILKEIRYPAVSAAEEPAIVRFQAAKELTTSPEEVVIDYLPRERTGDAEERRALVVIVQRALVNAHRTLCQAAGLKLAALTPRPWGAIACWRHAVRMRQLPEPANGVVGLLSVTSHWGEFSVGRQGELLFTRPMTALSDREAGLLGEIRRNLMLHASQSPQLPVGAVCVATGLEQDPLRERLAESLAVAVHSFNPLAGVDCPSVPPDLQGGFAGAVGLLHGVAEYRSLPLNLAQPKEPRPPRDPKKRRLLIGAAAAVVALLAVVGWGVAEMNRREDELAILGLTRLDLDAQLVQIEEDDKRIKAIGEWVDGGVVWLDEFYDLTDRFPDPATIRLTHLAGQPLARGKDGRAVARLNAKLIMADRRGVDNLISHWVQDEYYRVDAPVPGRNNSGVDRFRFPQQFTVQVDIARRPPARYVRRLLDTRTQDRRGADDGDEFFPNNLGFGEER